MKYYQRYNPFRWDNGNRIKLDARGGVWLCGGRGFSRYDEKAMINESTENLQRPRIPWMETFNNKTAQITFMLGRNVR